MKQNQHLYLARRRKEDMKAIDLPMKAPEGRPKGSSQQKKLVEEWQKSHPDGKKSDCIRDTGLSKPTVYRWWKVAVKTSESHVKPLENKKCTFVSRESEKPLTLPTAKAGGFLLQPLLHWLIPFGISMSYTVSTS